jgi:hypothetical protein
MDVDPRIQNARPGWALFVLASPVVVAAIVAALYVGMWWLGMSGRPPGGDTVQFEVIGCDDAATVLAARLAHRAPAGDLVDATQAAHAPAGGRIEAAHRDAGAGDGAPGGARRGSGGGHRRFV